jgi:hypothetical protein
VATFKWTPHYCIESLYLDDADFFGLKYWHIKAMEIDKSIRETTFA